MYPVSAAYKTAIGQNVRDVRITGTITLKDDTIINITDEDIVQGSLYVTEQCVAGEDIEVGNVYASEMGLSLSTPIANPYSLDGARIHIYFGINVGSLWEYVPLGYFYVTEIQRKANNVNLTALDGMLLFDIPVGEPGSSSPRNFVVHACEQAGVTLGTSVFEIDTFANAGVLLAAPDASKIKTCRDLLMWACQIMGAFARMNRSGELEIVPIKARPSVKTMNKAERFNSDVSDFAVKITKVSMQIGDANYARGVEGMTMVLDENPLLAGLSETQINQMLDYLLAQITTAVYVPFNSNFIGDPALQPGDFVTLADTSVLGGGDVASIITHSTWRYRGPHNLKAAGKHGLVRGVQNQQMKAVSSIVAIARAAQDLALAANQSTQLIKDAIGGHVLIRQSPDETNEILIMDHPDPTQATKIWRWNMGGLGYSDNCVGADNPDREYEIAMTMDGAINANFIKTGSLDAGVVTIGPQTTFAPGYDPTQIVAGSTVGMGVDADCVGLWHFDGSLNSHKGVAAIGDENFDTGCFGQALNIATGKELKVPTTGMDASQGTINFRAKNLAESANGSVLIDLPNNVGNQGIFCGIADDGKLFIEDVGLQFQSVETSQADFQTGTLVDVVATSAGNLELAKDGTDVTYTETSQTDFQAGTLTDVVATSAGNLELATGKAFGTREKVVDLSSVGANNSGSIINFAKTDAKVTNATFGRASVAYLEDGQQVAANVPRFEQGKFDKAVMVEEGTTNIAHDPNTDNAWWNAAPTSGIAWGLSNDWSATEQALKVRSYSSSHHGHSFYLDIQRDVWFTLRAKIKNVKNALYNLFYLALYNSAGTCIRTNYVPEILAQYNWTGHDTPDYTEAWITYRIPSGVFTDAVKYTVQLFGNGSSESEIYLKDIQLEQKPYKTTWHPYNSTRSPETLTIPSSVLNPQEGAVAFWYKMGRSGSIAPSGKHDNFFGLNSKLWSIYQGNGIENELRFRAADSWGGPNIQTAVNWDEGDILFIVARWKLPDIYLDVWNYTKGTYAFGSATGVTYTGSPTLAYVNCGFGDFAGYNNGLIDDLAIFDYAPTDEEIQAWYEADEPIPFQSGCTYKMDFDNNLQATVGTVVVEVALSVDGGDNYGQYSEVKSGLSIPGLACDTDLTNGRLKIKETLYTSDDSVTPQLHSLDLSIYASYKSSGYRYKEYDISTIGKVGSSKITWTENKPASTTLTVKAAVSTDGGSTYGGWATCTNGSSIPVLTQGMDISNARLKVQEDLATSDGTKTPQLQSLTIEVGSDVQRAYGPNKSTLTAWDSLSLAWKPERLSLVVNDEEACFIENPGLPTSLGSHIYIGTDRNLAHSINTYVDELRIDKVYREVNIRTGWHKTGVPFYTSEDMKQWPGYVKVETDGLKAYDSSDALRVLLGSWLSGAVRKYGIKIIDGEIYSTLFQTGAEGATTFIRLDPEGNFSAYNNGKRIIFMQASANEGRIRLGDGASDPQKMSLLANYDIGGYRMSRLEGRNGLDLSGGVGDFRLLPDGSMQAYLASGKEFYVQGNLWATGQKNAVVPTSYGQRLLYCMEMPEVKFMDEGTGELINGLCRIDLDPIFLETIEPNTPETPFIVHLTPYDWLMLRVKEIGDTYFIVEEKDGLDGKFSWQLSATRKGYAGERMRRVDDDEGLLTSNWEDELDGFLEQES